MSDAADPGRAIGVLNEKPLHAALKAWYAQPGDLLELPVAGYVVDIVREETLIEIQTRNLSAIRRKLEALSAHRPTHLVYPIAVDKWIVRLADDGQSVLGRRRSPKRGVIWQLFRELVSVSHLCPRPTFTLEVSFIQEEEVRQQDGRRAWRTHGWRRQERRLLSVLGSQRFETPADFGRLLPADLAEPFTSARLAAAVGQPARCGRQITYCLRTMGEIAEVGRQGNARLYQRA